jgi:hypothetical protein
MVSKNSKSNKPEYNIGNCFVKTDTGAIYKIVKATFVDAAKQHGEWVIIGDWLYDCETIHGDKRPNVRYYESRLVTEFYQVPDDSEAVVNLYGS